MKIVFSKSKLIKIIKTEKNIGFIPTMGAIHLGHKSLIKKASKQCNKTVVSMFINKPQFNKKNDFLKYPRLLKKDIEALNKLKVDYLFLPSDKQIYPNGHNKDIKISSFSKKLCGKFRPGHFIAVVDVIDRFIKIIKPEKIYFGEKDMQQLKIVEHFLKRNNIKTKVIACKTIRDNNGIALSSRNYLLSTKEKIIASKVYKYLLSNKKFIIKNKKFINKIKRYFLSIGVRKIDYIKILDINKIFIPHKKKNKYRIFIAYYLGSTRLIDNI